MRLCQRASRHNLCTIMTFYGFCKACTPRTSFFQLSDEYNKRIISYSRPRDSAHPRKHHIANFVVLLTSLHIHDQISFAHWSLVRHARVWTLLCVLARIALVAVSSGIYHSQSLARIQRRPRRQSVACTLPVV